MRCGKAPAQGKAYCPDCGRSGNAANAKIVAARRAAGVCTRCGGSPLKTALTCEPCADREALLRNARSHDLTVDEYTQLIAGGCRICGSKDDLQVDHDHACCDYVASGRHRSRSCKKCTRGVLCGRHNTVASRLEDPEALEVLRYLMSTRSSAPLVLGVIVK